MKKNYVVIKVRTSMNILIRRLEPDEKRISELEDWSEEIT
jgi:hypothetical protein